MVIPTPNQGIPEQQGADPADLPSAQASWDGVMENRLFQRFLSDADRVARHNVGLVEGEVWHLAAEDRNEQWNGTDPIALYRRSLFSYARRITDAAAINNSVTLVNDATLATTLPAVKLARAVGIHLVLATQRPSVDVITGVIMANFSARVAYLVNSKVDSRTILDMNGAEQLIGQCDMLYLPPGVAKPLRIQSPFISADEVDKVTDFISSQKGFSKPYGLPSVIAAKKKSMQDGGDRDELFEEAARLIVRYQQGSVSLLQRKLKVGYARAARIVDELESAGIVGPFDGSKAREVLVETEEELETLL